MQGFALSNRLRHIRPILKNWIRLNGQLAGGWASSGDVPWWYNERAQLSVFAGAVWRAGGSCFEEFSGQKHFKNPAKHRLNVLYSGRVDLYFELGSVEYVGEAKNTWSGYSRNDGRATKRISKRLQNACDDVGQTTPSGMRRLGIVFVAPYFRPTVKTRIDDLLRQWLAEIQAVQADARAWVFPPAARLMLGTDGFYYPGVAILLQQVKRRRS